MNEPESTWDAIQRLAAEEPEQRAGTDGWNSGSSGTDDVPVRPLPAHMVEHRMPDGTLVRPAAPVPEHVPVERTGGTMPEHVPAPDQALVRLGGAVHVERVLAQRDVPEVRHALMAYGPAGLYRYDIGLTSATPWGDAEVFHVIKVWYQEPDGSQVLSASGRLGGMPEPHAVAATVQGILNTLERIKAIQENRDAYPVRTPDKRPDGSPVVYGSPPRRVRRVRDNPQA